VQTVLDHACRERAIPIISKPPLDPRRHLKVISRPPFRRLLRQMFPIPCLRFMKTYGINP